MIKKILLSMIICLTFTNHLKVKATDEIVKNAKSVIVIEEETGEILYDFESNIKRSPASTTKIMSIKLILDAIKNGIIKHDQQITTSKHANSMGGSQIYLSVGEKMSVDDLLKAVVIASANDACVALAEAIAGSEEAFVKKMNNEAKRLNMNNTQFINATGLHDENHYTTASDLSKIAKELLNKYSDEIISLSSTYEYYLRQDSKKPFWLVNTNKLIRTNEGIDGLKTGWTNQAGYCLVSTKKMNDMRLICVVMGCENVEKRTNDTISLLNYCFANYEKKTMFKKGSIIETKKDILINPENFNLAIKEDINKVIKKGEELNNIKYEVEIHNVLSDDVGKLNVYIDDVLYNSYPLVVVEDVKKHSFLTLFNKIVKSIL